jgi:hypothetical protein
VYITEDSVSKLLESTPTLPHLSDRSQNLLRSEYERHTLIVLWL